MSGMSELCVCVCVCVCVGRDNFTIKQSIPFYSSIDKAYITTRYAQIKVLWLTKVCANFDKSTR